MAVVSGGSERTVRAEEGGRETGFLRYSDGFRIDVLRADDEETAERLVRSVMASAAYVGAGEVSVHAVDPDGTVGRACRRLGFSASGGCPCCQRESTACLTMKFRDRYVLSLLGIDRPVFQKEDDGRFSAWRDGARPVEELRRFVESALDPSDPGFIPPEDRIAVFDMDGTILSENNPGDIEWAMYLRRVLFDPGYVPDDEQRDLAEEMIKVIRTGVKGPGFTQRKNRCNARAFKGMSVDEYRKYVSDFISEPSSTYEGASRRNLFYEPMMQLVRYLEESGFEVFVCSATEALSVRTTLAGTGIPPYRVIATEYSLTASGRGDIDAVNYVMRPYDRLIYTGEIVTVASGMNKVTKLAHGLGKRPVIAFGNGSGDYSMLTYVSSNPAHKGKCFMLIADDSERDYGSVERTASVRAHAEEEGWTIISMKDDFERIYDGCVRPRYKDIGELFDSGRKI